jgi:hypothetical protein
MMAQEQFSDLGGQGRILPRNACLEEVVFENKPQGAGPALLKCLRSFFASFYSSYGWHS